MRNRIYELINAFNELGVINIKFNDKELLDSVRALKLGNKSALEKIYKLTFKKVYYFSLMITKNEEITSDVIQEVYLSVFKNIGSLKDDALFIAWLNRITYTATMKELNKTNKKPINITEEEIHMKLINYETPIDKYIENENVKEIMQCILNLKQKHRMILIYKYFNNYTIKEISEILQCPEGTVKSRLSTAKALLKVKLDENVYKLNNII